MSEATFKIEFAGPYVSVQDGGRRNFMRFGVPASGAMDRLSFAAANVALGNRADAPGIEISPGGLTLICLSGMVSFSVAGGSFLVDHGGRNMGSWSIATIRAGERLTIRPGRWGSWTYLAFAGILDCGHWLGSAATHALSGLGGGKLVTGKTLSVRSAETRTEREGAIAFPVTARPPSTVRVVIGPQDRFFARSTIDTLLASPFRLSDAYDRMGVRLNGPSIAPEGKLDMPSEAIVRGSIQVSGDGVATVLLADHQTTGGYPKIATVIGPDIDALTQLRAREFVSFAAVAPSEAIEIARARSLATGRYLDALIKPRGTMEQRMLQENLIDGVTDGSSEAIERDRHTA